MEKLKRHCKHPSMLISYLLIVFGALNQSAGAFEGLIDGRYFGGILLIIGLIDGWLSFKYQS